MLSLLLAFHMLAATRTVLFSPSDAIVLASFALTVSLFALLLQFAQRTRNVELGPAKKMIFFRNVEETVSKLRHDVGVLHSQRDALQAALADAVEARRKADERIKALAGDARKHYETREHVLVEDRKALKAQLDEAHATLKNERAQRKVTDSTAAA